MYRRRLFLQAARTGQRFRKDSYHLIPHPAVPVLYATTVAHVLSAWRPRFLEYILSDEEDPRSRYALSVVFKSTVNRLVTMVARDIGERLGAQGLFGHNVVSQMEMDNCGMAIAEGDILVVCIRVFTEILLERYTFPEPSHPDTLLAKHYAGILSACSVMLEKFPKGHRDPQFGALILPQCEPALIALGHSLAYSAALDSGTPRPLLDLFELAMVKQDAGWYSQHADITEEERLLGEDGAAARALPHLKEYVDALDIRQYVTAPTVSDTAWDAWMDALKWSEGSRGVQLRLGNPKL